MHADLVSVVRPFDRLSPKESGGQFGDQYSGLPDTSGFDLCRDLPVRSFEADEPIIEENHKDGRLYILRSGSVAVRKRDVEVNRLSSAGSIFGEVGLLLDQPLRAFFGRRQRHGHRHGSYDVRQAVAEPAAVLNDSDVTRERSAALVALIIIGAWLLAQLLPLVPDTR